MILPSLTCLFVYCPFLQKNNIAHPACHRTTLGWGRDKYSYDVILDGGKDSYINSFLICEVLIAKTLQPAKLNIFSLYNQEAIDLKFIVHNYNSLI